ncbi:CaiB/BaiF CoA transferase family protein [Halobaculum gomorrense]|uniref:Crotonobetainyl-CoA:carnitine CoA-transferase CaiB n=1 Tax=Halobaculum gomorrense TaxID=43928 RepID=A0A1M5JK84_9EURY|nr:CaiB/BaiF CoA-transferase family protein [Halobaculum gomorrense]SHG40972.1 Crotonobetainyl-CoA:carnitine CoA-transferase CaiB [Halobaculum gomorrense]
MTETGPLSDLTVVELTVHRAGPFAGAMLADLGAEVIKIERPGVGDPSRVQGVGPEGRSGYFMANNRDKRSVELDLKSDAGTEAALELLADADVFIENFGYGVAEKLGLGYEAIAERNEDIVYASVKGYGETGPLREKKGLDLILQAEGGIMSVTGPEDGDPVKVGQAIGDLTAGLFATVALLARLHERERIDDDDRAAVEAFTGKLDVGLFDAIVSVMNEYVTFHSMDGRVPGPQGTTHQSMCPYGLFEAADGHFVTGVPSDERWDDFVDLVGREELREYPTNEQRMANREAVRAVLEEEFREEPVDHWLEALTDAGFPNGPLNDLADVVDHEQAEARGLVREFDDPDAGEVLLPGHPVNFPDFETTIDRPAPRLGEHTEAVFQEVASDQTTLDEWTAAGAFGPVDD